MQQNNNKVTIKIRDNIKQDKKLFILKAIFALSKLSLRMHTQVIQRHTQLIKNQFFSSISPHACIFLFCNCNSQVLLLKINSEYCILTGIFCYKLFLICICFLFFSNMVYLLVKRSAVLSYSQLSYSNRICFLNRSRDVQAKLNNFLFYNYNNQY